MAKLPCPQELWPAFSSLLDAALQLPPGQRTAWLARLGPEHAEVLPWIMGVIASDGADSNSGFMTSLPGIELPDDDFVPGQQVGVYLLERRLGAGGMGEVWLASRSDGTLNRRVALKLPHAYLMAGTLLRRFERERDILAALSHTHIALLYDAGVDELRHPYLAMEWVDGTSITDHCRDTKSSVQQRLDLFLQVLDAVAYAHGRLIAHRDIKPSNILVTADRQAKLLDFGIAKLLTGEADSGETQLTRAGTRLATPDYAAPEQLAGEPISVSADIYALGVVLHELLAGQRPVRPARRDAIFRASSMIRPDHPARVAGMDVKQLRRALSGDLDAIIARALEPKPADRYPSAESFAQDIRLSRQDRPITARHISRGTVALKYVRRHWLGVSMAAALLLVIIAGSLGIAWQGLRAEREAERATSIKNFLIGVFRASDPRIAHRKPRGEITARELLDISTNSIDKEFSRQPATQIELLGVTAEIYRELDENKRSAMLYAREAELAREHFGASDVHSIEGLLGQAYNEVTDGDYSHALLLLARSDPLIHAAALDATATRARWLMIKGEALSADPARVTEAGAALSAAAGLFASAAPRDPLYPDALIDLGTLTLEQTRYELAAGYFRQAIVVAAGEGKLIGDLLMANAGLALALKDKGDFDGAERAFKAGTEAAGNTYGRNSGSFWGISSDWARFRYERGDRQAALETFESLLAALPQDRDFRNAYETVEASEVLRKYGRCLAIDGQGQRAWQLLLRAQSLLVTSASHPIDTRRLQFDLGEALEASGRAADARVAYSSALTIFDSQDTPTSQRSVAHERWGRFLMTQGSFDAAAAEFHAALKFAEGHVTEASVRARTGLGEIAAHRGDAEAALKETAQAMAQMAVIEGSYDVRVRPYVWRRRAAALALAGNLGEALTLTQNAHAAEVQYYAPDSLPLVATNRLLQHLSKQIASR